MGKKPQKAKIDWNEEQEIKQSGFHTIANTLCAIVEARITRNNLAIGVAARTQSKVVALLSAKELTVTAIS
jgi:hypothetical protein